MNHEPNSGLAQKFAFQIPDYWTPEQAFAVYEFLNELTEAIARIYGDALGDEYRQQLGCSLLPQNLGCNDEDNEHDF
jgi:hypothetical protein